MHLSLPHSSIKQVIITAFLGTPHSSAVQNSWVVQGPLKFGQICWCLRHHWQSCVCIFDFGKISWWDLGSHHHKWYSKRPLSVPGCQDGRKSRHSTPMWPKGSQRIAQKKNNKVGENSKLIHRGTEQRSTYLQISIWIWKWHSVIVTGAALIVQEMIHQPKHSKKYRKITRGPETYY